jgi:hypothetical protein
MPIRPLTIDAEHMVVKGVAGKYMGLGRWVAKAVTPGGTTLYLTWGQAMAPDHEDCYNSMYSPSDTRHVIFNL